MRSSPLLCGALLGALLGTAVACNRSDGDAPPSGSAPGPASSPGLAGIELDRGGPEYKEEDLAVVPDFEAEAERTITKENYPAELDAIESELDASLPDAGAGRPVGDAGRSDPDAGRPRRRPRPLPEPL